MCHFISSLHVTSTFTYFFHSVSCKHDTLATSPILHLQKLKKYFSCSLVTETFIHFRFLSNEIYFAAFYLALIYFLELSCINRVSDLANCRKDCGVGRHRRGVCHGWQFRVLPSVQRFFLVNPFLMKMCNEIMIIYFVWKFVKLTWALSYFNRLKKVLLCPSSLYPDPLL